MKYVILLLLLMACQVPVTSFEECAAGNPVMESYPRQCRANGQTFVEALPPEPGYHECTKTEKQAEICTADYSPVCGLVDNGIRCITTPCHSTNAETFTNGCSACGTAYGYYLGSCNEQTFVVCKETVTGFDPKEYADQNNGICVDICPGNYDPYMTQIGVELCINHYGIKEVEQWEMCDRSSETCNCVRAHETTRGEQIDNAEYRCAPSAYSERMLFTSGIDRLDTNGKRSVAIA